MTVPAPDYERAHAPGPTSVPLRILVWIEFLDPEAGARLRVALHDLVPVAWTWGASDPHGCFNGSATAYLAPDDGVRAERDLQVILDRFEPGNTMVSVIRAAEAPVGVQDAALPTP